MPSEGWIATSLGVRVSAPRLTLTFPVSSSRVALLTVVAERHRHRGAGARIEARVTSGTPHLHLAVSCEDGMHDVLASPGGISAAEIESDAPLVVIRRQDGVVAELLHAGGTHAAVQREDLATRGA
jgi:hypothetical protein